MTAFLSKQQARFKDNDEFNIGAKDLRDQAADIDALPSNQRRGGPFLVIYLTHDEAVAAGRGDNASLDQIPVDRLCVGCQARVDLHPDGPGQWLVLGYEARTTPGGLRVHLDGNFSDAAGAAVPVKWYKVGSQEAAEANVPLLDPAHNYPINTVVRAVYGGVSYLFSSKNGGAHPAPADFNGDGNWGPVAPQTPATVLTASYPLSYLQYVLSTFPASIAAGVQYFIPGNWNGSATTQGVEVEGGQGGFAALGTLVQGSSRTAVTVDVAAGTYQAVGGPAGPVAPQWVAGKQVAGALVFNAGLVFRVSQDIANGQAAPTATNAYYQLVGPGTPTIASTTSTGVVRVGPGVRVAGSNGVLRNEALFYTRDTVYAPYDGSQEASVAFGFTCAVNGHPQVSISTAAAQTGDVLAVRNLGAASTQLNASGATLDGQASLMLEPLGWVVLKYEAGNLVTVQRGSLTAPGAGGSPATGPWPPFTGGVVDDAAKTFRATAPAYCRTSELEYTLNAGAAATVVTEAMRSGDVVTVAGLASKAAGQVGLRMRTGGTRPASTWLFNATAFTGNAFTPYSIQESDPAIRTSGGFQGYSSGSAFGGGLVYNPNPGAWYEVTVPQGATRVVFEGYKDASSCDKATATVNGNPVGTGAMYNAGGTIGQSVYFEFTGVAGGDVLRLTNAATNSGGLLIDQISFYP